MPEYRTTDNRTTPGSVLGTMMLQILRRISDDVALEEPKDPWDQAISRPRADHHYCSIAGEFGGLGGMNRREQEELLLFCGTRKQRKVIKQRRKAAMAGMSEVQREEFLLIHGSPAERKAIKERRKARENH